MLQVEFSDEVIEILDTLADVERYSPQEIVERGSYRRSL
jgi:hypothetical protein